MDITETIKAIDNNKSLNYHQVESTLRQYHEFVLLWCMENQVDDLHVYMKLPNVSHYPPSLAEFVKECEEAAYYSGDSSNDDDDDDDQVINNTNRSTTTTNHQLFKKPNIKRKAHVVQCINLMDDDTSSDEDVTHMLPPTTKLPF